MMFNFFTKSEKLPLKGFKVALNNDRSKKFGIAADSLETLKKKIAIKFNLKSFNLFLSDGSLIESNDYFVSLPTQSSIVIVTDGEEMKTDLQIVIESFRIINHEILNARELVKDFVLNNKDNDVFNALNHVQNEIEEKISLSLREEDPEWFHGVDVKVTTKEEVLRRKAQDRIKGYFYKTKDELIRSSIYRTNYNSRKIIDDLLSDFYLFLNGVDYFSCLFDRTFEFKYEPRLINDETDATEIGVKAKRRRIDSVTKEKVKESELFKKFEVALCDDQGNFNCHGVWNATNCSYEHKINPYSSRESVILFQIFNLDHQIEISRSIFPSIIKKVEELSNNVPCEIHNKPAICLSTLTYFSEIFTISNLKLVHIVCHDKGCHTVLKSNGRLLCKDCKEYKSLQKLKLKIS